MKTLRTILILFLAAYLGVGQAFAAALTSACIWSLVGSGSSTNNGGMFDPSQTGNMLTDLASTSTSSTTPNFSSGTYTFVSGDIGNWIFVGAGSGWQTGFYKITAVPGGAATVDAAIGHVILYNTTTTAFSLSTVAGCGATTGGTWAIDYAGPGQASSNITNSTFACNNSTTLTNSANTFTKAMVGNAIHITAGTGFTVGWYTITAVASATSCTINVAATSVNETTGTGFIGGANALLDNINSATAGLGPVAGNYVWFQGTFSEGSTVVGTLFAGSSGLPISLKGYGTYWGDFYAGRSNTNGPLTLTNAAILNFTTTGRLNENGSAWLVNEGLEITTTSVTAPAVTLGSEGAIKRSYVSSSSTSNSAVGIEAANVQGVIDDCDVVMTGAAGTFIGAYCVGAASRVMNSRITLLNTTNAAAVGVELSGSSTFATGNQVIGPGAATFANCASLGIWVPAATDVATISGNTVVGFVDDVNIITSATVLSVVENNMLTDSSGWGLNTNGSPVYQSNNRFRNNTSGTVSTATGWTATTNYAVQTSGGSSDYAGLTSSPANLQLLSGTAGVGNGLQKPSNIGAIQSSSTGGEIDSGHP